MFRRVLIIVLLACASLHAAAIDALDLVPTFHSVGATVRYGRDSAGVAVQLMYRVNGVAEWQAALDPVFDKEKSEFRGSLLLLKPDTPYEVRAVLLDVAKQPIAERSATVRTWSDAIPVKEVRTLPAGVSNKPLTIS